MSDWRCAVCGKESGMYGHYGYLNGRTPPLGFTCDPDGKLQEKQKIAKEEHNKAEYERLKAKYG